MPTKQETFNRVRDHLLQQNKKALFNGGCAYRGEDGTKCAAGCLIPDEKYGSAMEGRSVGTCRLLDQVFIEEGHDLGLVGQLQYVHDQRDPAEWPSELEKVAIQFGLQFKE